MKFEPVTIKDIARELGLSTSTVSRALRDGSEISGRTKQRVLDYAAKINYHPNPIAQSLKERRSHSIGVIVCEIANNFFSQAIDGIESIAYDRGYHVIITQSHESVEREAINVSHLASRSVDGLLVSLSSETADIAHFRRLHDKGLPIVFFDRIADDIMTHKVIANNFKGAFDGTDYLLSQGAKNVAHITASPHLSITKERLSGYKRALLLNGIPFREEYVKYCEHGGMIDEEVEQAIASLLSMRNKPDAIFIANDKITTGCMRALKKYDASVRTGIAIAGFTNSKLTGLFTPPLTHVRQPAFKMGVAATELLIGLIESKRPVTEFETRMLETELVIRDEPVR
jgi:LacI family transcriptional regulator